MADAWRLAAGTLTVLPTPAPRTVTAGTARGAVLLAPLAVLPLGVLVVGVGFLGRFLGLPAVATAVLALATLAAGSRALHWDGLSDVVDGLAASHDPARSLQVMKSGTSGPAGTVAVVCMVLLQVAALAPLLSTPRGAVLAGGLVCASRCALVLACLRGIPAARTDGLGSAWAGTCSVLSAVLMWVLLVPVVAALASWAAVDWWRGALAVAVAAAVVLTLLRRVVRRFGGVTGDVFGAAVELAFSAMLLLAASG
jgi:adenosylcobinamide-GDP ribazoletransferase